MNHKSLLTLALLSCVISLYADRNVTPTIITRSQGRDGALKIAGLSEKVHLYDENNYVNIDGTVGYQRSFRDKKIAECLFGSDVQGCGAILVQGSEVANRDANAWLADYFYLPPDFNSNFTISPRIQNFIVNLDLYVGLDDIMEGLYFRVHGPITHSTWNLNYNELCDQNFTGSYRPGYFSNGAMLNDQLLNTFADYACGKAPLNVSRSTINTVGANNNNSVAFEGLKYAKIDTSSRSRTGFADLRMELGYNFLQSDDYHLGLNLQVVAPTGSRLQAEYAFDPIIGNGNHWEVGAGLTGHYIAWRSCEEDQFLGLYLDASITHVNNSKEQRTFDLCGRPNSRYMLAEKMGTPVNLLSAATNNNQVPVSQFKGVFTPVANLTTLDVNVRSAVQADIAVMLNYTRNSWAFDLGYDFWVKSCEKIGLPSRPTSECCPSLCSIEANTYALKGDAQVFGFVTGTSSGLATNEPVALSATECGATIHKGTNADANVDDCTGINRFQNCGIDNAQFAQAGLTGTPVNLAFTPNSIAASDRIKTSLEPKFINCCDINLQRTRGLSHKVFVNANYSWERESWSPYFGLGASAEFAKNSSSSCDSTPTIDCDSACSNNSCCEPSCCTDCLDCAVSQWAVYLKGGINFN